MTQHEADERPPIVVRHAQIDLRPEGSSDSQEAIPRYWWADDPFRTHFFNALSSTFPFGEAFFVRSVRYYADRVDDPQLEKEIRGFAGQEGQHSRIHDAHVDLLVDQGYGGLATHNRIVDRVLKWQNGKAPRFCLAATAAVEHLTAILARQVLRDRGDWIDEMHPDMARLWRWHALEESEHKSVAFDVMVAAGIPRWMRNGAMAFCTAGLFMETLERMAYLFLKDGRLFEGRSWMAGWRFLFGRGGFLRGVGRDYRAWYRADFHPEAIDDREMIARFAPRVTAEVSA